MCSGCQLQSAGSIVKTWLRDCRRLETLQEKAEEAEKKATKEAEEKDKKEAEENRQFTEVYDLCHTFLAQRAKT